MRLRVMSRAGTIAATISLVFLASGVATCTAIAGARTDGVAAVVVDSYMGCTITDAFATLNADWQDYGSVPLSITTGGTLCAGQFTLADLEASGADTVILVDTPLQLGLTPSEIDALREYAQSGHTLLGFSVIFTGRHKSDNGLATLFGLIDQSHWGALAADRGQPPTYPLHMKDPVDQVLFRGVSNPYASTTAGSKLKPADKHWSANELAGARILTTNKSHTSAITYDDGPGYHAIYIANDAEYHSTTADLQFIYNAITDTSTPPAP